MMLPLVFVLGFLASALLAWAVRRVAIRAGALAPIRSDRWHRVPTPTFGGVAIAATTVVVAGAAFTWGLTDAWRQMALVLGAAVVLFGMGVLDDRTELRPLPRLLAALFVGAVLLFGLTFTTETVVPWWETTILIIWYGGVVHAFNQVDNMDGASAGLALLASGFVAAMFGVELGSLFVALLAGFAGAVAGFLVWNVKPARLFMGNCGSFFLGATIAGTSLVVLVRPEARLAVDGVAFCLALAIPLLDTSFVLVLRRLAGRDATGGGTDHLAHRLVSAGFTERNAVATLWAIAVAGGGTAWFVHGDGMARLPVASFVVVAVLLFGVYLARVPAYAGEDFKALQNAPFAPFLRDLAYRWHALEMLLDVVLIATVLYVSCRIRFEDQRLDIVLPMFTALLPVVLACKLLALYLSGVYDRMWGFFSIRDQFAVVRGVALGSVGSVLLAAYLYKFERFSRGVFLIDGVLLTVVLVAARGSFRAIGEASTLRNGRARRALIYGAGSGGQLLVRELRANREWNLAPVVFLDDDPAKHKKLLMGVRVAGGAEMIERTLERFHIEDVVFGAAALDPDSERLVRTVCAARGIRVRRFHVEMTE